MTPLFPPEVFRFQVGLKKNEPPAFHGSSPDRLRILQERRRLLDEHKSRYVAALPEASPLIEETAEWVAKWNSSATSSYSLGKSANIEQLAADWEPDFLLLSAGLDGVPRLKAGAVCFPSFWDMPEKLGMTVDQIHEVVPTLNPTLGDQINRFLAKLPPGVSWERLNWGLARTPEWNCHPAFHRPRLDPPFSLEEIYVRVEFQSFVRLPKSGGVLFGIRLQVAPLIQVIQNPSEKAGLIQALETMPESIDQYKGLSKGRECLVQWLRQGASAPAGQ